MIVTLHLRAVTPIIAYTAIFISSSVVYWLLVRAASRAELSDRMLALILMVLFAVRFSFLWMEPVASDDVYRYMWDGRVQAAGINPFQFAPTDEHLKFLHSERLPSLVNYPHMKTIYFPLSQWLFYVSYHLSGDQVWGIKVLIFLAEILTVIGLALLMRESAYSLWRVLIYAANPLVILQFSLDAHLDALGFPFLMFGLLFYQRKNRVAALLLFGLSLLVKPVAVVLLPILFLHERSFINKAKVVLIPMAVVIISFIPYFFGASPLESLTVFSKHWTFNGALFNVVFPLVSNNQTARFWCLAILAVALFLLYLSKKPLYEKTALAVLFVLLCSPVAHPWYMGWLVVLLPLSPVSSGLALAGTASLASVTPVVQQLSPWVLVLEYAPVIVLLLLDLRRSTTLYEVVDP